MNPITTENPGLLPADALRVVGDALAAAAAARYPGGAVAVTFEAPRRPEFGDFATNLAFALAQTARRAPQLVAGELIEAAREASPELARVLASIEPSGGFINLRLAPAIWQNAVAHILREGTAYGSAPSNGRRISLEFGSANPTGPLVVVQGRTLSLGGTLAAVMRARGYDVFVEWIINDTGSQLDTLGRSLYARYRQIENPDFPFPDDGYPGDYLLPIARSLYARDGSRWCDAPESEWLEIFARYARDELVAQQQRTVERFRVAYDLWQSERELHEAGKIREGIARLEERGLTYERDGATYFRSTAFGDDKDRVVRRSDGRPTYFALDVAYHYEKLKRADRVIDILGPDHHGYIGRLHGLAAALGFPGHLDVLISGQVGLMRGGEQVSMSKRAGHIVTLDEILDEVGVDAARFLFIVPTFESPLVFDMALAVEKSNDNPVYYVQYGHARIASVLRNAAAEASSDPSLAALIEPSELALARRLAEFPAVLEGIAEHRAPHRLARYARDVAADFHAFYTTCRILDAEPTRREARLALARATQIVLARALQLAGVSAPDAM